MLNSSQDHLIYIPGLGRISLANFESSIKRDKSLSSFKEFIHQAWPHVEPSSPLKWNWHLDEFCSTLETAYRKKIETGAGSRIIVNVPPGTAKSLIFSVQFNGWIWAKHPEFQFLTASYTPDLSIFQSLRLRTLITSPWYRENFPHVRLSSDQNAKEKFDTSAGGWRISTSVGGAGTGFHPNFMILIDDPVKAQDSRSETKMKEANTWIDSTISTRVMHDPIILLVMQRLNENDPSGHLLSKGGWTHICFPMRFETRKKNENDIRNIPSPQDHRTEAGELLWPEVWPEEKVAREEIDLDLGASGQLQQDPIPEAGLLYNRDMFDFVDSIDEKLIEVARGWDIASTDKAEKNAGKNDWTTGTKIGKGESGVFYIIDHIYEQREIVDSLMLATAKLDGKKCKIREGSGSGKATIASHRLIFAGYDYEPSPETRSTGDKIARNKPFRVQFKGRNVKILRAPWNDRYISVLCSFPLGRCDDDVDSTSNAFNALHEDTPKKPARRGWGS